MTCCPTRRRRWSPWQSLPTLRFAFPAQRLALISDFLAVGTKLFFFFDVWCGELASKVLHYCHLQSVCLFVPLSVVHQYYVTGGRNLRRDSERSKVSRTHPSLTASSPFTSTPHFLLDCFTSCLLGCLTSCYIASLPVWQMASLPAGFKHSWTPSASCRW